MVTKMQEKPLFLLLAFMELEVMQVPPYRLG